MDIDLVKKKASELPDRVGLPEPIDAPALEGARQLAERTVAKLDEKTAEKTADPKTQSDKDWVKPCIHRMLTSLAPNGARNDTCIRLAYDMAKRGIDRDDTLTKLTLWNGTYCSPPLNDSELATTVDSAYSPDGTADYGCNDHLLADNCDRNCPLNAGRIPPPLIDGSPNPGAASTIFKIRAAAKGKRHVGFAKATAELYEAMLVAGTFLHDRHKNAYYFNPRTRTVVDIEYDNMELMDEFGSYMIMRSDDIFKYAVEMLRHLARKNGKETKVYKTCHCKKDPLTVYMHFSDNTMLRIGAGSVDRVNNGVDGVLFSMGGAMAPFRLLDKMPVESPFREHILDKINFVDDKTTVRQRALLFEMWWLSLFFEELMPVKPILALIGEPGSGKSMTLRRVGTLLYGDEFDVMPIPKTADDFDVVVADSYFLALDNADTRCDWLNDKLAVASTGGKVKKRKLYKDVEVVEMPIRCFLGLTSMTPHFTRNDVAERLLLMKVDKIDDWLDEYMLMEGLRNARDDIMTETTGKIQMAIKALDGADRSSVKIRARMTVFNTFAALVARARGIEDEVNDAFTATVAEQADFSVVDEPIFRLFRTWRKLYDAVDEVPLAQLREDFITMAGRDRIRFPQAASQEAFRKKFVRLVPAMQRHIDFKIEKGAKGRPTTVVFTKTQNN